MNTEKFQRQLDLEEEMQSMGVAKFREQVQKARENSLESTTSGVLHIMTHAFQPLCDGIDAWKEKHKRGEVMQGRQPRAYPLLKDYKTDVLAFLTMKTVMDNISSEQHLTGLTTAIGKQVQNEKNFKEFKKQSTAHYKKVKDDVIKRSTSMSHVSKVLTRSARRDDVNLTTYSNTEKHQIGSVLLSLFIEHTGLVRLYTAPQMSGKKKRKSHKVEPTEKTTEWLKTTHARCELLSPVVLPMLIPPKDWETPFEGGFISDHIQTPMVRRVPRAYLAEIENIDMWEVYQAINHLQKTSWIVNSKVLKVLKLFVDNNLPTHLVPSGSETPLPVKPIDIDTNEDSRWAWRKSASRIYEENIRSRSKYIGLQKKIQVAERYEKEDEFYFVYTLDFRGRIYPVQVHLNPQGDDLSKALLKFTEGKPVDDETGAWLAVHGANTFGYDKTDLQSRVDWVKENTTNIIESVEDPLANTFWQEADKPWQFLAFCFEWAEFQNDPENFVSHLSVALDGSCNGLQNFSAMLRDPVGGKATNLTPTDMPQDIYQQVADVLKEKIRREALAGVAHAVCWEGFINRKLVKRPTMTMPYGATLSGYKQQLYDEIQSWKDAGIPTPSFEDHGYTECFYLAQVIKDTLGEVVVAAQVVMDWLQEVSKIISNENLPIFWVTPVGFPVLQNYKNIVTKLVRTEIAGKFHNSRVAQGEGLKMNKRKMKASIAPNFVHSCDAAHLTRTVNLCETNGINSLHMVHDSYGTHAADIPVLKQVLRHAFVQVHETDPLQSFYEAMCHQSSTPELIPPPPTKGTLDLSLVKESDFFFA